MHLTAPAWEDPEYWCATRAKRAFGTHAKAVSYFSKNQVCEVFSSCPASELVEAASREHQKGPPACPASFHATQVEGLCTKSVSPNLAARKCPPGATKGKCIGESMDDHTAKKECMNSGGEYIGKNAEGLHQCRFAPDAERGTFSVTWALDHGQSA